MTRGEFPTLVIGQMIVRFEPSKLTRDTQGLPAAISGGLEISIEDMTTRKWFKVETQGNGYFFKTLPKGGAGSKS